jgi:hypothetical protein
VIPAVPEVALPDRMLVIVEDWRMPVAGIADDPQRMAENFRKPR